MLSPKVNSDVPESGSLSHIPIPYWDIATWGRSLLIQISLTQLGPNKATSMDGIGTEILKNYIALAWSLLAPGYLP